MNCDGRKEVKTNISSSMVSVDELDNNDAQRILDEENVFTFEEDFVVDLEWFDLAYANTMDTSNLYDTAPTGERYPLTWGDDRANAPVYRWRGCNYSILTGLCSKGYVLKRLACCCSSRCWGMLKH